MRRSIVLQEILWPIFMWTLREQPRAAFGLSLTVLPMTEGTTGDQLTRQELEELRRMFEEEDHRPGSVHRGR